MTAIWIECTHAIETFTWLGVWWVASDILGHYQRVSFLRLGTPPKLCTTIETSNRRAPTWPLWPPAWLSLSKIPKRDQREQRHLPRGLFSPLITPRLGNNSYRLFRTVKFGFRKEVSPSKIHFSWPRITIGIRIRIISRSRIHTRASNNFPT